jgi:hypothetical protein
VGYRARYVSYAAPDPGHDHGSLIVKCGINDP